MPYDTNISAFKLHSREESPSIITASLLPSVCVSFLCETSLHSNKLTHSGVGLLLSAAEGLYSTFSFFLSSFSLLSLFFLSSFFFYSHGYSLPTQYSLILSGSAYPTYLAIELQMPCVWSQIAMLSYLMFRSSLFSFRCPLALCLEYDLTPSVYQMVWRAEGGVCHYFLFAPCPYQW